MAAIVLSGIGALFIVFILTIVISNVATNRENRKRATALLEQSQANASRQNEMLERIALALERLSPPP